MDTWAHDFGDNLKRVTANERKRPEWNAITIFYQALERSDRNLMLSIAVDSRYQFAELFRKGTHLNTTQELLVSAVDQVKEWFVEDFEEMWRNKLHGDPNDRPRRRKSRSRKVI